MTVTRQCWHCYWHLVSILRNTLSLVTNQKSLFLSGSIPVRLIRRLWQPQADCMGQSQRFLHLGKWGLHHTQKQIVMFHTSPADLFSHWGADWTGRRHIFENLDECTKEHKNCPSFCYPISPAIASKHIAAALAWRHRKSHKRTERPRPERPFWFWDSKMCFLIIPGVDSIVWKMGYILVLTSTSTSFKKTNYLRNGVIWRFERMSSHTQVIPLLSTHSVTPTHDLPLQLPHVSQVFLQQPANPHFIQAGWVYEEGGTVNVCIHGQSLKGEHVNGEFGWGGTWGSWHSHTRLS